MTRTVVTVLALVVITRAWALEIPELRNAEADKARRQQEQEAMELEQAHAETLVKLHTEYLKTLREALLRATREGKIDEAIVIRERIGRIEKRLARAEVLSQPPSKTEKALGYRLRPAPPEAKVFEGHAYLQVDKWMTWHEAYLWCKNHGGYLACITSRDENNFVGKMLKGNHAAWLGGTDMEREGRWQWLTGERSRFTHWQRNEPGRKGRGEDFLRISGRGRQGSWAAEAGDRKHQFICEWDHVPSKEDTK